MRALLQPLLRTGNSNKIINLITAYIDLSPAAPSPCMAADAAVAHAAVHTQVVRTACCALVQQGCAIEADMLAHKAQQRSMLTAPVHNAWTYSSSSGRSFAASDSPALPGQPAARGLPVP